MSAADRAGRGLLRRSALLAVAPLVGLAMATPSNGAAAPPVASANEPAEQTAAWPYARFDAANTAHQVNPGAITDPAVLDREYLGGSLGQLVPADLAGDGRTSFLAIDSGRLSAYDVDFDQLWQSPLIRPGGIAGVGDLNGDGNREVVTYSGVQVFVLSGDSGEVLWSQAVPGTTQALTRQGTRVVDIVPGQQGDQLFLWGSSAFGTMLGFDQGFEEAQELWRTPDNEFAEAYIPAIAIGDMNGDGRDEVVMATCGSVITYDAETGQELLGEWNGRVDWTTGPGIDCRNYGNMFLEDLDGDGYPEVVIIADGVTLHLAVLQNGTDGLSLAYDEFIEHPENAKTLRSTFNSVGDMTGDGAIEAVYGLYNRDGSERWEVLVFDALTGTADPVAVLADTYLWGVQDVTGDDVPELLTSTSQTRVPSSYATIQVQAFDADAGAYVELWSAEDARWRVQSAPFHAVKQSISPAGRFAANEVLTSDDLSDGGLAAFVEFQDGSTAAYDFGSASVEQVWQRDGGNVLWQGSVGGSSRVAVQQDDGFVSYEDVDGTVVARITTGSLTGAPTVGPLGGARNSIILPGANGVQVFDYTPLGLAELWRVDGQGSMVYGSGTAVPIVDLEGDGTHGLVVADSFEGSSRLRYLDGDGNPIWDSVLTDLPAVSPGNGLYSWAAGDLRGTGTQDLYVAAFAGGYNTEVSRVVDGSDGTVVSSRNDNPLRPGIGFGPWVGNPGIADVNGDGKDEVFFRAKDITYRALDGDLSSVREVCCRGVFGEQGNEWLYHNPAFVDLTGDGTLEMLMTGGFDGFHAVEFDDDDPDGRLLWYHQTDPSDMLGRIAGSADITGNGEMEVATLHQDGFVRLWSGATGDLLDEYDAGQPGSSLVTGDVTGDGQVNVLYGTDDGRLAALEYESGGGLVESWTLDLGFEIGELALADVTGDGITEIVLTAADGFLYVIGDATASSPCPDRDDRSTVFVRSINSGVTNHDAGNGCTINDLIVEEDYPKKKELKVHVDDVTAQLLADGIITEKERDAIRRAAKRAKPAKPAKTSKR